MSNKPTEKDLYDQACAYFYYHAEQRTTMINFYIAVFGACIALYGSLLASYVLASLLVSVFLFFVSIIFFMIDLRNRFDVKQSQSVICQIEQDCDFDKPKGAYAYGVFSNEENLYKLYDLKCRRKSAEYKRLKKAHAAHLRGEHSDYEALLASYAAKASVSEKELEASLSSRPIVRLSFCIKWLYFGCGGISILAFVFALIKLLGAF